MTFLDVGALIFLSALSIGAISTGVFKWPE